MFTIVALTILLLCNGEVYSIPVRLSFPYDLNAADIVLTKAGLMKLSVSLCNEMLKLNRNMKQTVMSRLQDPGMNFPTKIEIPCPVKLFG